MSVFGNTCGVRIYRGPCTCKTACPKCQIGCWNPAAYRNPWFGKPGHQIYWWRDPYSYAEFLCVEHYDDAVKDIEEYEELYQTKGVCWNEIYLWRSREAYHMGMWSRGFACSG